MLACPIRRMSAGRLTPARTMSVAKVWRKRCGLAFFTPVVRRWWRNRERSPAGVMRLAAGAALQGNKQWRRRDIGPLQAEIVIQQLDGFGSQGQEAGLVSLAADADLRLRERTSSRLRASTSRERRPCSSISPTMARSREVRKLDQNRATSSTESGTMVRLASFTRTRLRAANRSAEAHGSAAPVADLQRWSDLLRAHPGRHQRSARSTTATR